MMMMMLMMMMLHRFRSKGVDVKLQRKENDMLSKALSDNGVLGLCPVHASLQDGPKKQWLP